MAIIINDHEPEGAQTIEVKLPGSSKRWAIRTAEACTVADLRRIAAGDLDFYIELFPEEARPLVEQLHPSQLNDFILAWTGQNGPKE